MLHPMRRSAVTRSLATVVLVVSFVACSSAPSTRPRAPEEVETFGDGPRLRYLVLGDSTAVAEGGTYERGIARSTARHLASAHTVEMKNVAVSGARMRDVLRDQLPRSAGFFPDVVLLDVGANDVIHLTSARSIERDLTQVISALRARNCDVRIVLTGSADMTTPPRIPRALRWLAARRTRALNRVFMRAVDRDGLTFAPIAHETGPLFRRDRTLFAADRFHPNDRGYATWIAVINPALDRAGAQERRCE